MNKIYIPIVFLLMLGGLTGCDTISAGTAIVESKSAQTIENTRRINDSAARFVMAAPCGMTVGAYHRTLNDMEKRAVDLLCDGDMETHVTADDVQSLRDFIELMERSKDAVNDGATE